jgi:hypothetical protein
MDNDPKTISCFGSLLIPSTRKFADISDYVDGKKTEFP